MGARLRPGTRTPDAPRRWCSRGASGSCGCGQGAVGAPGRTAIGTVRARPVPVSLCDTTTIAEARRRYGAMDRDPAAVPGPLRKTVLSVVAQRMA